jgi:hypothetical protein
MQPRRTALALLLCIAGTACADGEPGWTGTISDSAGITMVANTNTGIWAPGGEWILEEELRIGVAEGEPQYQFGSVHRIAVDSRNRILVLDGMEQHIQVYSPEGVYQQTIGGRGEGPGELQAAMFLLIGPGDTILVPDGRTLRFNRYAPDGSASGSSRMPLEAGRPITFKTTPSGVIAEQIRPAAVPGEPPPENPEDVLVLLASDGTVSDTLMTFPSGELIGPAGVRVFASEPTWDITDELQLIFGVTDDYRIGVYAGGRLTRIITKPFQRTPVTEQDQAAVMGVMERRWAAAPSVTEEMKARLRSRWSFADVYPAYQSLAFGPAGTIWVQRVKLVSEFSDDELENWQNARSAEWDVFDRDGRLLGVVAMPPRFTPMQFRGDEIYGVARDESGVEYVVRLRVSGDLGEETGR